ncbi:MAG: post-segregation antitoxin CcdA [Gammaproteobacteria bacterium]|nr:post-segregation antitoxin CcdA [Gammaproteobacteria bacterium]
MPGDQIPYPSFAHSSLLSRSTAKKATNFSFSTDELEVDWNLGINLSQVCVSDLPDSVWREHERRWRKDHADFIAAYNRMIEREGLPLEEWRPF